MKTKLFLALLALGLTSLIGCKDGVDIPIDGNLIIPSYIIAIELVDHSGVNISEIAAAQTTGKVVCSDGISRNLWPLFHCYIASDSIKYYVVETNSHYGKDEVIPQLTWKLKCKEVFGNEEIHTIESKWESYGENYSMRCTSFEFEGKTYTPELKNGYWTARVVVNR